MHDYEQVFHAFFIVSSLGSTDTYPLFSDIFSQGLFTLNKMEINFQIIFLLLSNCKKLFFCRFQPIFAFELTSNINIECESKCKISKNCDNPGKNCVF